MNKENIKSVLLVLLFTISLVLTQRLWFYIPFDGVISTANDIDFEDIDIDVTDILSPQNFVISFGGGNYTVFFSEPYEVWNIDRPIITDSNNSYNKKDIWIWETAKAILRDYLSQDYEVQEMSYDEWIKIKKFKSIAMSFACEIPSDSFINALMDSKNITKIKDEIDTILIQVAEEQRTNIYFANSENKKYFKLISEVKDNRIRRLIENIEKVGEKMRYIDYVTLQSTSGVKSDVLIPLFDDDTSTPIQVYSAKNQIDVSDEIAVKNQAYQFFGKTFDFVKEIKEIDGTVIYMYGYGEKTLKLNKNGMLEYSEKVKKDKVGINLDFIDSLKYAVKYVEEKGGQWPVNINNTYLSHYKPVEKDNKKGYRFSFNYRLKGLPIFIPDIAEDKGIEVEIIGNQITYYKRMVKNPPQKLNYEENEIFSVYNNDKENKVLNVLDVLIKNKELIKSNYVKFSMNEEDKEQVFKIDELIEDIELVYYAYKDKLIPVWEITIDDLVYYFDLYTGNIYHILQK